MTNQDGITALPSTEACPANDLGDGVERIDEPGVETGPYATLSGFTDLSGPPIYGPDMTPYNANWEWWSFKDIRYWFQDTPNTSFPGGVPLIDRLGYDEKVQSGIWGCSVWEWRHKAASDYASLYILHCHCIYPTDVPPPIDRFQSLWSAQIWWWFMSDPPVPIAGIPFAPDYDNQGCNICWGIPFWPAPAGAGNVFGGYAIDDEDWLNRWGHVHVRHHGIHVPDRGSRVLTAGFHLPSIIITGGVPDFDIAVEIPEQ